MPAFLDKLLKILRSRRGKDMSFLCRHLLSQRGEASQTALAQEIINTYTAMDPAQRLKFYEMLCGAFSPDSKALQRAAANYLKNPNELNLSVLSAAVEPPRQELLRRINTAPRGTETLVAIRKHLLDLPPKSPDVSPLDADLRHLFRSWFNRGFLSLRSISWQTPAFILEELIRYESVHEINGWPDLRRRLQTDRRCFAFFSSGAYRRTDHFCGGGTGEWSNRRSGTFARRKRSRIDVRQSQHGHLLFHQQLPGWPTRNSLRQLLD